MSTKELQETIVKHMKAWQKIEYVTVSLTGQIMERSDNAIVKMIMEIIQRDSQQHYRIQEFIIDSLTSKTISLSTDELAQIWELIERHLEMEKKTTDLAKQAIEALQGKKMLVQEYLLNYLVADENKHVELLEQLSKIKSGIFPYA